MKIKKVLLYTAPAVLAGFLYLGETTGVGEVLGKTVKTVVNTIAQGSPTGSYRAILGTNVANTVATVTEEYNGGRSPVKNIVRWLADPKHLDKIEGTTVYGYMQYGIITTTTETEIEVPDDPSSESTKVVPDDSSSEGSKVVPTADPEAEERARREQEKQREEAAVKVQKEAEQRVANFINYIQNAIQKARDEETGKVIIKTDYFSCFTKDMLKLLEDNSDLSYEIHYRYQGKRYVLVIPANADYSQLQDSNGYYGFRYLGSVFG